MSMYYLHRAGTTTGPFAPGRIAQMIDAGEIGDETLACAHGTEDWIPAHLVAEWPERAKRSPVKEFPKVPQRPFHVIAGITILAGVGLMFSPISPIGLIILLIGMALNRRHFHCGNCGNRVDKISALCLGCRVPLLPWRLQDTVRESRVSLILLGIALAIAMMGWVVLRFL